MTEKKQKSFVLYADFESALLKLSIKERGILFTMIFSYVNRGEIDEILTTTPLVDMAFEIIRAQLDRDREKYEAICERNAKNGRNGGRPKGETETQKTQWVFEKPKKPYNDNNNKNNNKNNNYSDNDNYNKFGTLRSFDSAEFFAAALARSYADGEEKN